jgi:hypothetical protein
VARMLADALVFMTGPVPLAADRSIAEAKSTWEPTAVENVAEAEIAPMSDQRSNDQKVVTFPTGKPKA